MEKLELQAEQEYTLILTGEEIAAYVAYQTSHIKRIEVTMQKITEQLQQQLKKQDNG
jgi:hypothetical protein